MRPFPQRGELGIDQHHAIENGRGDFIENAAAALAHGKQPFLVGAVGFAGVARVCDGSLARERTAQACEEGDPDKHDDDRLHGRTFRKRKAPVGHEFSGRRTP